MSSASMGELTGVLAERDCKNGNCNEEIETLPIFPVARISTVAVSPAMTGKLIRHRYHFSVLILSGRMDSQKAKASN